MKEFVQKLSKNSLILLLIALLPLLFININDSHDWGDDFALYIHQAKNICEGESPQDTKLVFNDDNPMMISNVSGGFSLLIAPVYYFFGLNYRAFNLYISLLMILLGITLFYFFKGYMKRPLALLFVLLILYHRYTLDLKQDVLSDLPFMFLFFLLIIIYTKFSNRSVWINLLIAIFAGFVISIRSMALVFPFAVGAEFVLAFISFLRKKTEKTAMLKRFQITAILFIGSIGFYFFINWLFFPEPSEGSYMGYLKEFNLWHVFANNVLYYAGWFRWFFDFFRIHIIVQRFFLVVMTGLFLFGIFLKMRKHFDFSDIIFFGFLALILIYPAKPGFRYILPLMPFVFVYIFFSLGLLDHLIARGKHILAFILPFVMLLMYYPGVVYFIENHQEMLKGPEMPEALEVFDYISENVSDTSIIVFRKPRLLSLYTEKYGMANRVNQMDAEVTDSIYDAQGVDFLLRNTKSLIDSPLLVYLAKYPEKFDTVFVNERFVLYERADSSKSEQQ